MGPWHYTYSYVPAKDTLYQSINLDAHVHGSVHRSLGVVVLQNLRYKLAHHTVLSHLQDQVNTHLWCRSFLYGFEA